jgi:hypothetical protein
MGIITFVRMWTYDQKKSFFLSFLSFVFFVNVILKRFI